MVIHVKIFNKYGNDHKTDRNFIINYHDFKKKEVLKQLKNTGYSVIIWG